MNQASNGNIRQAVKSKYWASQLLLPDEILKEPDGMIEGLLNKQLDLVTENQRLRTEIEGNNISILSSLKQCDTFVINPKCLHFYQVDWSNDNFFVFKDKETYGLEPRSLNFEDKAGRPTNITFASQHFPGKNLAEFH